ncbi:hypothetical protein EVAR_72563_1 [Eumeta japonica]|uniref:Uncharacterized protein n=1 Tax=Eumeta variegata TaxID=151549 RepID=A0A4C1T4F5_EUMVA|nr:hypothetical protein EVAR_72563_1 [Eumeta japonica]
MDQRDSDKENLFEMELVLWTKRMKALESLQQTSQRAEVFKKPHTTSSKETTKGFINLSANNPSIHHDNTEYVPFRRTTAINISDLVTDETINLESSSSCQTRSSKDSDKVSFEPNEMTGRSTLYNKDMKTGKNTAVEVQMAPEVYLEQLICPCQNSYTEESFNRGFGSFSLALLVLAPH